MIMASGQVVPYSMSSQLQLPQFTDMRLCSCQPYVEVIALLQEFAKHIRCEYFRQRLNSHSESQEVLNNSKEQKTDAHQNYSPAESAEVLNISDLQKYRDLHSQDSLCEAELTATGATRIAMDDSGNLVWDLHSRVILSWWNAIMKRAWKICDIHSLIDQISKKIEDIFYIAAHQSDQEIARRERVMVLLNIFTRDLFKLGVTTSCISEYSLLYLLSEDPSPAHLPLYNQLTKHFMILIMYGHRYLRCGSMKFGLHLLSLPKDAWRASDFTRVFVNVLPHDKFEEYRLQVDATREDIWLNWRALRGACGKCKPCSECNGVTKAIFMKLTENGQVSCGKCTACTDCQKRAMHCNGRVAKLVNVSSPRSLENLCRLKLYEIIPAHRLPEVVKCLELPEHLKVKVTLEIDNLLSWNVRRLL
jgi:hypothetical protein